MYITPKEMITILSKLTFFPTLPTTKFFGPHACSMVRVKVRVPVVRSRWYQRVAVGFLDVCSDPVRIG